ncbi:hypothetical protein GCM10010112_39010 [Actinoplanes lobatus]|uniref:Lipoprotein n=1 Tax=Actinoplanes lobatus TaxID=113568 RepID=A0A7W7HGX5_9ACTN|nr:hypothetical protein [Actinoplanes lobatus]MBB4750354.1 hypothetical protein [Actinoplanes lobatus]GGN71584.1 hypothetical protein GCM10010112_39010 [Actinoplanes lobatus]GIE41852.1 hypothetical protein Alo02nite_47500 [Actinoplanes lobatus]
MKLVRGFAVAAATFCLAGCTWLEPPVDASDIADPVLGPGEELVGAIPGPGTPAYRFSFGGSACDSAEGVVDWAGQAMSMAITGAGPEAGTSISLRVLLLPESSWFRVVTSPAEIGPVLDMPSGWIAFDPSRVDDFAESGNTVGDSGDHDPIQLTKLLEASNGVARAGHRRYSGTLDLTKATGTLLLSAEKIRKLGDAAAAVPFTASVDAAGRLSALTADIPAVGGQAGGTCRIALDDYGKAPTPKEPPADERGDADEDRIYEILNS